MKNPSNEAVRVRLTDFRRCLLRSSASPTSNLWEFISSSTWETCHVSCMTSKQSQEPHKKAVPRLRDSPSGCGAKITQPRSSLLVGLCTRHCEKSQKRNTYQSFVDVLPGRSLFSSLILLIAAVISAPLKKVIRGRFLRLHLRSPPPIHFPISEAIDNPLAT